jgi:hypothetical protein
VFLVISPNAHLEGQAKLRSLQLKATMQYPEAFAVVIPVTMKIICAGI